MQVLGEANLEVLSVQLDATFEGAEMPIDDEEEKIEGEFVIISPEPLILADTKDTTETQSKSESPVLLHLPSKSTEEIETSDKISMDVENKDEKDECNGVNVARLPDQELLDVLPV